MSDSYNTWDIVQAKHQVSFIFFTKELKIIDSVYKMCIIEL